MTTIHIPETLYQQLTAASAQQGQSVEQLVEEAVRQLLTSQVDDAAVVRQLAQMVEEAVQYVVSAMRHEHLQLQWSADEQGGEWSFQVYRLSHKVRVTAVRRGGEARFVVDGVEVAAELNALREALQTHLIPHSRARPATGSPDS